MEQKMSMQVNRLAGETSWLEVRMALGIFAQSYPNKILPQWGFGIAPADTAVPVHGITLPTQLQ